MKFSIVSTFYNNTIEEVRLLKESIINQTYTNWEWIISDDFSQDSTSHIQYLKSLPFEDKRIKYVQQKTKKEIFWNPQTYATGDIVILIGGDDTILPKTLEIYSNHFLNRNPYGFLVVICITPFCPFWGYRDRADSPFSTFIDSMVFGLISFKFISDRMTPSMTMSGFPFCSVGDLNTIFA